MKNAPKAIPTLSESDKIRFFSKISTTPTVKGCIDWAACKTRDGYGQFGIGRSVFRAHRIAYLLHHGIDPSELLVLHTCDNPSCCNPEHFFLGTDFDNNRDRAEKGRSRSVSGDNHHSRIRPEVMARGEAQGSAKLKESDIPAIRADLRSQSKIAADYGVDQKVISRIKLRKSWKHVA